MNSFDRNREWSRESISQELKHRERPEAYRRGEKEDEFIPGSERQEEIVKSRVDRWLSFMTSRKTLARHQAIRATWFSESNNDDMGLRLTQSSNAKGAMVQTVGRGWRDGSMLFLPAELFFLLDTSRAIFEPPRSMLPVNFEASHLPPLTIQRSFIELLGYDYAFFPPYSERGKRVRRAYRKIFQKKKKKSEKGATSESNEQREQAMENLQEREESTLDSFTLEQSSVSLRSFAAYSVFSHLRRMGHIAAMPLNMFHYKEEKEEEEEEDEQEKNENAMKRKRDEEKGNQEEEERGEGQVKKRSRANNSASKYPYSFLKSRGPKQVQTRLESEFKGEKEQERLNENDSTHSRISLFLRHTGKSFKKSNPGIPDFEVVICDYRYQKRRKRNVADFVFI